MVSLESISEQFSELGIEPSPAILGRCLDLCQTYRINDPVEFVEQWMAFSVSNLGGAEPTLDNLSELERKDLIKNAGAAVSAAAPVAVKRAGALPVVSPSRGRVFGASNASGHHSAVNGAQNADGSDMADNLMDSYAGISTPKANNRHQSRLQQLQQGDQSTVDCSPTPADSPLSGSVQSYVSGQAVYTFGNAALVQKAAWTSSNRRRVPVRHVGPAVQEPAVQDKYMFDTLAEKSFCAADRMYGIGHQICLRLQAAQQTDDADAADDTKRTVFDTIVHPDMASQHRMLCVGRICSDEPESRLTVHSAMLLSTDDRRVRSVRLNFDKLRSVAVFPGQTVAVRGHCPSGDTLYVDELHAERADAGRLARPPMPLRLGDEDGAGNALSVLLAAGPYTADDDLAYEVLHDLLSYVRDNRPDVLLMFGPFVAAEHALIVDGGVLQETFDAFFEKIVAEVMAKCGSETQVIMVASQADVNSSWVYPTHPLSVRASYPNLIVVGDPSVLNIGGVHFAVTATDVLQHLVDEELAINAGERVKRTVQHLFQQASFYPIDPPHPDIGIDSELAAKYAGLPNIPHVLLVPGALKCFIRDISGCLVVNPGRLYERKARGTFARLVITLPERDDSIISNYMACQVIKV